MRRKISSTYQPFSTYRHIIWEVLSRKRATIWRAFQRGCRNVVWELFSGPWAKMRLKNTTATKIDRNRHYIFFFFMCDLPRFLFIFSFSADKTFNLGTRKEFSGDVRKKLRRRTLGNTPMQTLWHEYRCVFEL